MTSNLGKWDRWNGTQPGVAHPFADTITYQLGADWLADCDPVEDWGCGGGWLRNHIPADRYRGVDGSATPFADTAVADLATYRSDVDGVFMRHVLEHNYNWLAILDNALASARRRLFLVLFTPTAPVTHEIAYADDPGVPDISFCLDDLVDRIHAAGFGVAIELVDTASQYSRETMLRCERTPL